MDTAVISPDGKRIDTNISCRIYVTMVSGGLAGMRSAVQFHGDARNDLKLCSCTERNWCRKQKSRTMPPVHCAGIRRQPCGRARVFCDAVSELYFNITFRLNALHCLECERSSWRKYEAYCAHIIKKWQSLSQRFWGFVTRFLAVRLVSYGTAHNFLLCS